MYRLNLTESYVPPQNDAVILETTAGGLLREIGKKHSSAPALIEVTENGEIGRSWTYGELLADSEKLALALSTRFSPGERITIWAPNVPEWLLIEYACALAGIVLVTANPAYQVKELRYVLEQSNSAALYLTASYRGNPMSEIADEACSGLNNIREFIDVEDHAALYCVGDKPPVLPTVTPDDAAQIQYTSGTTGFPKGAILHHRGLTNNARLIFERGNLNQNTVYANHMPMFHTSGCGIAALGCLQAGCKLLMVKLFDPAAVLRLVETEAVTAFIGVPTMMVAMLEALEHQPIDTSSIEIAISGGSMVSPELVRRVRDKFGCAFEIVYGQTETSPVLTQHGLDDSLDDICNSIGQPLPQTGVSIRSVGENEVVAVDTIGEICSFGYCNMIGYNGDDQATAETIDSDGWLHTGDLGAMDSRGYVRITGRVKEMIIRGGENLFPAEIENVLLEHPEVAEVAVVGLSDNKWGEIVACFIRMLDGHHADPQALRSYCRNHISPQKTPTVWVAVNEFPLTGSGKIQKFALRNAYVAGKYDELES